MEYTGERIIPEKMDPMNGMLLEHIARYYFATNYAQGRVLDIACGAGYGAKMLAKKNKKVIDEIIAVDIDEEAIDYGQGQYYHPLLSFQVADLTDEQLTNQLGTFDTIVSFETIEHVPDDEFAIQQFHRLLKPGGKLIVSTPFGKGRGKPTKEPFHYHQITVYEFFSLFNSFSDTEFYFQKGVMFEPPRKGQRYPIGLAVATK
ncbi:class I SAM-dependent methyltransferase [Texcoconibacillus texcoconensis]|uniref:2-polyprenyl-3-methyl-5-hydroxy-6-metoxy-1, 4-benzoquinol methylase n=1 Tax=Texcoconibacillus texcoconensis TaxID=1095777 RepID=A0A840QRL6_9BACI|nr:class I SAM-dependent methyltransferase [Texcoconibacillus texcoconensis]MBB5174004.1 2-polyprenyl-3-methyl-5-hydroxy-6-metoxy-1,4-benzoquinol methylase [Texcoconibacillus texcoconensis]